MATGEPTQELLNSDGVALRFCSDSHDVDVVLLESETAGLKASSSGTPAARRHGQTSPVKLMRSQGTKLLCQ